MTENRHEILLQQAGEVLRKLALPDAETAEHVAESVLRQEVYWEQGTESGEKLLFLRFFSPVIQREEIFLGNTLLNDFLSKAFARAVRDSDLGQTSLVANDLENYYFLLRTSADLAQLAEAFRAEVERSLPDLFFGDSDFEKGVYGDLARMFTFRKSDFEPFPVYAVPKFISQHLEKGVRRVLNKLLSPVGFYQSIRAVLAALAFFYGRTSGGAGDAQSFANFLDHLANDPDYDGLLFSDELRDALNISEVDKDSIKRSIDKETYDVEKLRQLLSGLAAAFHASIDGGSTKWLMGFVHKDKKFIDLPASTYLDLILSDAQLGYHLFSQPSIPPNPVLCRLCNKSSALVEDRYITTGLNSFRFHNQSVRRQAEKVCARCALYSYLAQKLLGTEMVSAGGKLPQVPKTCNLIFHYGRHTDREVEHLTRQIDLTWTLVRKHRAVEQVRRDLKEQLRKLKEKHEKANPQKKAVLANEMTETEKKFQEAEKAIHDAEVDLYELPWLKNLGASPIPAENPTLDVLANLQLSASKVERHVLGLGMGGYRMILFVLPQIRPPYDAKEHDFAQRRFSDSRVTVTAVLAFLRQVCGCDGPFYYQSLPTLTPEAFRRNTFYIRNEPIGVEQGLQEYEAVTQLAWRLIRERGSKGFVKKVVEAEKLLEEPLSTFASVMRKSAILGQRKGEYRRLPGNYRQDWSAWDLTEYVRFIQKLSKLQEAH